MIRKMAISTIAVLAVGGGILAGTGVASAAADDGDNGSVTGTLTTGNDKGMTTEGTEGDGCVQLRQAGPSSDSDTNLPEAKYWMVNSGSATIFYGENCTGTSAELSTKDGAQNYAHGVYRSVVFGTANDPKPSLPQTGVPDPGDTRTVPGTPTIGG